jgi:hypothetical protein
MIRTNRCHLSALKATDYDAVKLLWMDDRVRFYRGGAIKE